MTRIGRWIPEHVAIVLLRECLVLIEQRDIDGIFEIVADGTGGSNFKIYPNPAAISAELKQERQNADTFIERNFRNHRVISSAFSNLQFSDLKTAKKSVTVTNTENNKKADAKLHSIKVKIPLQDRYEFGELRFLEMAENIYWAPIGWQPQDYRNPQRRRTTSSCLPHRSCCASQSDPNEKDHPRGCQESD